MRTFVWGLGALVACVASATGVTDNSVTIAYDARPCCRAAMQNAVSAHSTFIYAGDGRPSPVVESVVNNFKGLLEGSTIIVVNTDGDEEQELAKVASFLAGTKGSTDARQIVESVRKQFRSDKTGFSLPIWLTDNSSKGNACVLGVRQNGPTSYSSLVSEKINKPLITGQHLSWIDRDVVQASVIAHEMYHCYEFMSGSMMAFWERAMETRMGYATHRSESAADAYATLYVLRNYDALATVRTVMQFRKLGMLNSDVEHNTSRTVERVFKSFNRDQLAMMTPEELILVAGDIRDDTLMDEKTFVSMKKSSIEITEAYRGLLVGFPGLDLTKAKLQLLVETTMLMDDGPPDGRITAHVMEEIATSLSRIGAESAVSSRFFQPLVERFAMKEIPSLRVAAYERR